MSELKQATLAHSIGLACREEVKSLLEDESCFPHLVELGMNPEIIDGTVMQLSKNKSRGPNENENNFRGKLSIRNIAANLWENDLVYKCIFEYFRGDKKKAEKLEKSLFTNEAKDYFKSLKNISADLVETGRTLDAEDMQDSAKGVLQPAKSFYDLLMNTTSEAIGEEKSKYTERLTESYKSGNFLSFLWNIYHEYDENPFFEIMHDLHTVDKLIRIFENNIELIIIGDPDIEKARRYCYEQRPVVDFLNEHISNTIGSIHALRKLREVSKGDFVDAPNKPVEKREYRSVMAASFRLDEHYKYPLGAEIRYEELRHMSEYLASRIELANRYNVSISTSGFLKYLTKKMDTREISPLLETESTGRNDVAKEASRLLKRFKSKVPKYEVNEADALSHLRDLRYTHRELRRLEREKSLVDGELAANFKYNTDNPVVSLRPV